HPVSVIVRLRGVPAASFAGRLRELSVEVDPMLRLRDLGTLDDTLHTEETLDRAILLAAILVIVSVLLLSTAGIYALMSFTVVRRRREIGIRSALGAGARGLVGTVLSRAMGQIAIGIAVGSALAALLDRAMEGGLTGGRGALLLLAVAALMAGVGIVAAIGPARRALRIMPTEALRAE
ncbi:MAG TPA: FtsX-like permease family protein, partial [Longimicrobiaceae bacterium]|nr:FtsX-like permease family protein [Longimicrobiaceae bacterium]